MTTAQTQGNTSANNSSAIGTTVDVVIGLQSEARDRFLYGPALNALEESFRGLNNTDVTSAIAARLGVVFVLAPIHVARIVTSHGYDAIKVTMAVRSGDPHAVVGELVSIGVGNVANLLTVPGGIAAGIKASKWFGLKGVAVGSVAGAGAALAFGSQLGAAAKWAYDTHVQNTPAGELASSLVAGTLNLSVRVRKPDAARAAVRPIATSVPETSVASSPGRRGGGAVRGVRDPSVPEGPNTYVVQPGDSLYRIACAHGLDPRALLEANPQITNENLIHPNQRIRLPFRPAPASGLEPHDTDAIEGEWLALPDLTSVVDPGGVRPVATGGYRIAGLGNVFGGYGPRVSGPVRNLQ